MRIKTNRFDYRNLTIAFLLILVIVESAILFKSYIKRDRIPQPCREGIVSVEDKTEEQSKGLIAIIVDDWGYNANHCRYIAGIDSPLTISILPNLDHSTYIAKCANKNKKEIILHLPLEPHKNYEKYPKDYVINTNMSDEEIENIFNKALESVPFAVGINNHMGSKATEDKRFMKILFSKMKKEGLYFVDSLVTNKTVCKEIADQLDLPFFARDIFLDNENNREYIENQFAQLVQISQKRGYAIGIAHDRTLSLRIIKEQIKDLTDKGFDFVTVKELIDSYENTRN